MEHGERSGVTVKWGEWSAWDSVLRGENGTAMLAGLFRETALEFRGIGLRKDHRMAVLDG